MKYLRTFEDVEEDLKPGDYIVYYNLQGYQNQNNSRYLIIKIINLNGNNFDIIVFFDEFDHISYYDFNLNKKNIKYKSNNLEDCIEYMEIISQSNKYNL